MTWLLFSILSCTILICNGNIADKAWKRNSKEGSRDVVKAPRGFSWFPDDESNKVICQEGHFHCKKDGDIHICIPPHWLCDGWHDCPGNEDEANCTVCDDHDFHCSKSANICIPQYQRCDGWHDCPDSEDEAECNESDCGGMYNTSSGTIDYPSGRVFYENNVHCEWDISVELGARVNISFTLFETEELWDKVTISEEGKIKATFSGHRNFTTWVSKTNHVTIIFESDFLVFGQGFVLNWNSFPSGVTTTTTTARPSPRPTNFHICQHIQLYKCAIPGVKLHCPDVCLGYP